MMTSLFETARTALGCVRPTPPSVTSQPKCGAWFRRVARAGWHVVRDRPVLFFGANVFLLIVDLTGLYSVQLLSSLTASLAGEDTSPASVFDIWVPKGPEIASLLFLALAVSIVMLRIVHRQLAARSENEMLAGLRLEMLKRIGSWSPDNNRRTAQESLEVLVMDGAQSANLLFRQLIALPVTHLLPLGAAIWLIYHNVNVVRHQSAFVLALLLLALVALPVFGWLFSKRIDRAFGKAVELAAKLTTETTSSLSKQEEIHLMDALPQPMQAYKRRLDEQAKAQTIASAGEGLADEIKNSIQPVLQALFLVYGSFAAFHNHDPATAGAIIGLYLFIPRAINPLQSVIDLVAGIGGAHSAIGGVLDILETAPIDSDSGGLTLAPADRSVTLSGVSLHFAGTATPALDNVSLHIEPGRITSIVGRPGAGKTTLLNVMAGLAVPDRGTIAIGVKMLADIATDSLRRHVVKVSQDPLLITASVRENFRLANADVSDAEIEEVCRRTGFWEILTRQQPNSPLDYTVVQKSSDGLSGRERQLLALTRALMLRPGILLLDEPTTGLDPDARKSLGEILLNAFRDTTVVVADRDIEFVRHLADEVHCLESGKVTSSGPPEVLLGRSSLFAELMQDELNPMHQTEPPSRPQTEWIDLVKRAESAGEFLVAFDLANHAMGEFPTEVELQYLAVRALARSGATQLAANLYEKFHLAHELDDDKIALGARILKDQAWQASGDARRALLQKSAGAYTAIFWRSANYYAGINAATLFSLAGDADRAAPLVEETAKACERHHPTNSLDLYYLEATRAELALLRSDIAETQAALTRAAPPEFKDWAALATTRRQLLEICRLRGLPAETIKWQSLPQIINYVGHMISPTGMAGRFPADQEAAVAGAITEYLARKQISVAYGSLACGADILFAEAMLARNGELHVVLPFELEEFKQVSVRRGGEGWGRRFDHCLARARSVRYATEDAYLGDDSLFSYATRLAMGLAILRAQNLGAEVRQVAVWDGAPPTGLAGTAVDIAYWRSKGRWTDVIPVTPSREFVAPGALAVRTDGTPHRRTQALLFGDFHGYSRLRDRDIPAFQETFMKAVAEILDQFGAGVHYRNTWGDAIFVVMDNVVEAARCALAIQNRLAQVARNDLAVRPELRLAGHFGPTFEGYDAIRHERTYFGAQVTRAARLEPVTPTNLVYITEPFAAALLLENATEFSCDYVGQLPAAKNYGTMRMHMLRAVN